LANPGRNDGDLEYFYTKPEVLLIK